MSTTQTTPAGRRKPTAKSNGTPPPDATQAAEAVAHEEQIATDAAVIRGDADELTPALFLKLLPLLRRPIPAGFIETIGVVTGKPYVSTGIKSVQVQFDRMDNVLTPLGWREFVDYEQEGRLATVTVEVGPVRSPFFARSSRGGVDRGSTVGNVYKGSYTNAAKVAFARVGPGHEVYVGVTDLDPDVHEPTAKAQEAPVAAGVPSKVETSGEPLGIKKAKALADAAWIIGVEAQLPLAVAHVLGEDPGPMDEKAAAANVLAGLTAMQAAKVETWLNRKAEQKSEQAADA